MSVVQAAVLALYCAILQVWCNPVSLKTCHWHVFLTLASTPSNYIKNKKRIPCGTHFLFLVEARGVEPLSESPSFGFSPGAGRVFKPFPSTHTRAQVRACGSFIIPSSVQSLAEAVPLVNDALAPAVRVPPAGHYTALSSVS